MSRASHPSEVLCFVFNGSEVFLLFLRMLHQTLYAHTCLLQLNNDVTFLIHVGSRISLMQLWLTLLLVFEAGTIIPLYGEEQVGFIHHLQQLH